MNWLKRLFGRGSKREPFDRNKPFRDRLFFYREGQLDADCESIDVEFCFTPDVDFRSQSIRITTTSLVMSQSKSVSELVTAWLHRGHINVALQFGGTGQMMKTKGIVDSVKIHDESATFSRVTYSILCEAKPFQ